VQIAIIILYLITLAILGIYGFHRSHLLMLYWKHRKNVRKPATPYAEEDLPVVTVQLPMFNEMYVAERLLESITLHRLPEEQAGDPGAGRQHGRDRPDRLRNKVKSSRTRGFDAVYLHRTDRTGYKAGALAEATPVAKGEFLMVFDADFVPTPSIIRNLIHHFTDEKVGMVQARWGHINRDYSTLTHCQSMMLDGHFCIEHIARNRSGRFFNFNGTAGIWRRAAIADAGGWEHDTVTEDMDLSFRAQLKGWEFVYVPDAVAPAEIPCEMNSFKTQQFRWAKGSAQTTRKLLWTVLKADIPLKVKIECVFHLTNNFAYLFLVVLACCSSPTCSSARTCSTPELLLLDVPLFLSTCGSICVFYLVTQKELYGGWLAAVKRLPMMMAIGIGLSINNARAVIEGLFGKDITFVRTPKHGIENTQQAPHLEEGRLPRQLVHPQLLEVGFGLYFVVTIGLAIATGNYISVPFLILFMVGFLYVGGLSLYQPSPPLAPAHPCSLRSLGAGARAAVRRRMRAGDRGQVLGVHGLLGQRRPHLRHRPAGWLLHRAGLRPGLVPQRRRLRGVALRAQPHHGHLLHVPLPLELPQRLRVRGRRRRAPRERRLQPGPRHRPGQPPQREVLRRRRRRGQQRRAHVVARRGPDASMPL
jgi:cellulose synthase/poly-beta-1,6-N-acetylglucosamine synthase-like glycosyltransferase